MRDAPVPVVPGADFLAVIGAIWSHPKGPRAAVAKFNEVFARYGRAYHVAESKRI